MKARESRYHACLYFSTNTLARKIEKLAADVWSSINLSPSHAYLLMMVIEAPGVQPSLVASELQLSPSTITRLIEKLEKQKLVFRKSDGKTTNIYASAKARSLHPKMQQCARVFKEQYIGLLGAREVGELVHSVVRTADKLP